MPLGSSSLNVSGRNNPFTAPGDGSIPHTRGTLVSADMTIPMMSAAHHSSDTFQAVLGLIGSDTSQTTFSVLRTKKEYTAKEVFQALIARGRLMLGLSVLAEDGRDERVVIVCPPGSMRVTPQDAVIVLKRLASKHNSNSTVEKD